MPTTCWLPRRGRETQSLCLKRATGRDFSHAGIGRVELLDAMQGLCELLDHGESARPYTSALETAARENRRCRAHTPPRGCWRTCCRAASRFFFFSRLAQRMSKIAQGLLSRPISTQRTPAWRIFAAAAPRVARGASPAIEGPPTRLIFDTYPRPSTWRIESHYFPGGFARVCRVSPTVPD